MPVPPKIAACIDTVIKNKGDFNHFLLNNESLRFLIRENFDPEVLLAYDALVPYTYKADLGRYCMLYRFGGWYFDASVRLAANLAYVPESDLIIFKDAPNPGLQSWDLSTTVIYSKPNNDLFMRCIATVVANVKNNYYGINPLCPTGPSLFGKCNASVGDNPNCITGMLTPLTPMHSKKNYAFLMPDGTIFAWGKESWGTTQGDGLLAFDTTGTNSYNQLWNQRRIYNLQ